LKVIDVAAASILVGMIIYRHIPRTLIMVSNLINLFRNRI
jgi:hypothetical protein